VIVLAGSQADLEADAELLKGHFDVVGLVSLLVGDGILAKPLYSGYFT
jgi:hypothetical protein